jgi:peroxiredoxin
MTRVARRVARSSITAEQGGMMLNPGDKAPDFVGRDHNGNTVKLSDFKGKTVVLWFFPKADTPG